DRRLILLEYTKQSMLTGFGIALGFLRPLHGFVHHCHELRPPAKRIHGAALNQRFQDAIVEQPQIYFLTKLENRREPAKPLASLSDGFNSVVAHVFHGSQSETYRGLMRSEIRVADVKVRRLNRDS